MGYINSALATCDGCDVVGPHPILYLPEGWQYVDDGKDSRGVSINRRWYCRNCLQKMGRIHNLEEIGRI